MTWVNLFGEREMVEVVGGAFDGQLGYIKEPWIDARDQAAQPISYVVQLDSGVTERIEHAYLRSLGYKHPSYEQELEAERALRALRAERGDEDEGEDEGEGEGP